MSRVLALLPCLLLLVPCARAADPPAPLPPAALDAAGDRVAASVVVPDAARAVGQVRLVARGPFVVVQTLLDTKVLSRVVPEIESKETAGWPPTREGHVDMLRYVAALRAVADDGRTRGPDRHQRVLIEFVAGPDAAGVLLGTFTGEITHDQQPASRTVITLLDVQRAYVLHNMRRILADAFHLPDADLARLGPLGPLATLTEPAS